MRDRVLYGLWILLALLMPAAAIVGAVAIRPEPRHTCTVEIYQRHSTTIVDGVLIYEGQKIICRIGWK